jgi:hypothetical protein
MGLLDSIKHAFRRSKGRDWRDFRPTEAELAYSKHILEGQDSLQARLNDEMPAHWKKGGVKVHVSARVGGGTDNPFDHRSYPPKIHEFFEQLKAPDWLPSWSLASVTRATYAKMGGCHEVTASNICDAVAWQELDAIVQICGAFSYEHEWSDSRYVRQPGSEGTIGTAIARALAHEPPSYRQLLDYLIAEKAMIPREPPR